MIIKTLAIVLAAATVAIIAVVIIAFWRKVNLTLVQILLTMFATVAGILAGIISGRASARSQ